MTLTAEKSMTQKTKAWYPGKPGPAPTGVKRRLIFPWSVDVDEYEYLIRIARHTMPGPRRNKKVGPYLRKKIFRPGWREVLAELRRLQGANVK